MKDRRFTRIVGTDVSSRALEIAERKLRLDRLPERQRDRITLWQSALTYTDDRLKGFDAAVLMEVIEHVDPPRLPALEAAVFGHAHPATVVVTTPNVEYNVRYEGLVGMRHSDHRFEWTRAEFQAWAARVAAAHGYTVAYRGVGDDDPEVGTPTQLALFTAADKDAP
jgi:3' terminal RNA ribose 2'-O-methyltransferase Hen1